MTDDLVRLVAAHVHRALCTYVEDAWDTLIPELTSEELCAIARAIIPLVQAAERERCAMAADDVATFEDELPWHVRDRVAAAIRAHIGPEPCHLPAGHAGDCRPITWAELQELCDQADDRPLFEERRDG